MSTGIKEYDDQEEIMAAYNVATAILAGDEDGLKVYNAVKDDPTERNWLVSKLTQTATNLRTCHVDPDFGGVFLFDHVCQMYGLEWGTMIRPKVMVEDLMGAVETLKSLGNAQ